ncbi:hypothetical protein GSI_10103 [Ganoderma sinense ZZ0214-1]|uniref:Uncharacterized protein n=1 Tax=Ganoderma sinense ZZ0214-1 TaxID=1077348 RepID=A0A2G8RZN6_9APHY|nr:hypothetical protein GSI_10103 [Ganoderma sinense ZZ0214-1]
MAALEAVGLAPWSDGDAPPWIAPQAILLSYVRVQSTDDTSKTDPSPQVFITSRAFAFLAVLADVLLLAITWRVLAPSGQRGANLKSKGLAYIMFRDGAIYFILIMALNTTDLIFITYAMIRAEGGVGDSGVNAMAAIETFRTFLPPMLVSRFLLDLQEAHQRKVVVLGSSSLLDSPLSPSPGSGFGLGLPSTQSSIAFAPARSLSLGALGASIDPEDWDVELRDTHEEEGASASAHVAFKFPAPRRGHSKDGDGESPPASSPWAENKSLLDGRRVG